MSGHAISGWRCPICLVVYAPSVTECRCSARAELLGVFSTKRKEQEGEGKCDPVPPSQL